MSIRQFLLELAAIPLMVYLVISGTAAGWYILGLRDWRMMVWGLLIVTPIAIAPKFLLVLHFRRGG